MKRRGTSAGSLAAVIVAAAVGVASVAEAGVRSAGPTTVGPAGAGAEAERQDVVLGARAMVLAQAGALPEAAYVDEPQPGATVEDVSDGGEANESVLLNFEDGDIRAVIDSLATALGISYMIDPRVEGQITIRTLGRIPKSDLFPVFNRILRNNGIAAVKSGEVFHIVPVGEAKTRAIIPPTAATRAELAGSDSFVIEIIPCRHVSSDDMLSVIEPFITPGGDVFSYARGNLLIVTDLASNVRRMADLVTALDTSTFRGMRTRTFKIKHGDLDVLYEELGTLLASYGYAIDGSTGLSVIPIPRLEALTVISFDPSIFDQIAHWLEALDIPPEEGAGRKVRVYHVENAKAADLADILNELFGGGGGSSGGGIGGRIARGGAIGQTRQSFGRPAPRGRTTAVGSRARTSRLSTAQQVTSDGIVTAAQQTQGGGTAATVAQRRAAAAAAAGRRRPGGLAAQAARGGGASSVVIPGGRQAAAGRFGGIPAPPPIFKEEVRIVADEVSNALVILAVKQDYEMILDVLKEIDVVPRQVVIEVMIAEVTLTKGLEFGVEHAVRFGVGNVDGVYGVGQGRRISGEDGGDGNGDTPDATGDLGFDRALALFGIANSPASGLAAIITNKDDFAMLLRALANRSSVKLLSAPHIIAADNREAHIQVGESIPILTGTSSSVLTATSTVVNQVQYRDTGTILTILPQVNSAGLVNMQVTQEISAVGEESFGLTNSPSFRTREAETTMVVQGGDSILIGGIIDQQRRTTRRGVPFIMDIPVLGRFFRLETATHVRVELLILITPHVILTREESLRVTEEFKTGVTGLETLMNWARRRTLPALEEDAGVTEIDRR